MTSKTATKTNKATKPAKQLEIDAEARVLMADPIFRAALEEAKSTRYEDFVSLEELDRRLGPLTAEDEAIVDEYAAAFDRLETDQAAEVTDTQALILKAVLFAARYLRGERTFAEWTAYTGVAEAEIRAAAIALREVGKKTER